ncbi:glycosyl transferase, family 2 [Methanoregula boonei 6A8]|jgi:hypothetical protein|uniref:Glycosyl transferase, family 2 n=1 Tax=Methanoregula boonei (strain DSM 21154 / JCM 14090 / 6A8) TaxID=456442 RepID=A7I959_METB6|nr:glycosyltransferase family 2 protein [Methanoregula boonei]ABS56270.1 glycosyl transferase, family 2 [Methanoregula boonei 6A8]
MLMESPRVCIILLNWNGWQDTLACISSLRRITYPNYRIILIDNGSNDNSCDVFASHLDAGICFIPLKENLGFAKGCNFGMKYALENMNPDYILLLNNDTVVEPDFLSKVVQEAEASGAGMAQPLLLRMADHNIIDVSGHKLYWGLMFARGAGEPNKGQYKDSSGLMGVSGACALYKTEMIRQIGILDESYSHGSEDTEYGWRATKAGWKTAFIPSAIVYHRGQVSGKKMLKINPQLINAIYKDSARPCKTHGTRLQKIQFVFLMLYQGTRSVIGKYLGRHEFGCGPHIIAIREMIFG